MSEIPSHSRSTLRGPRRFMQRSADTFNVQSQQIGPPLPRTSAKHRHFHSAPETLCSNERSSDSLLLPTSRFVVQPVVGHESINEYRAIDPPTLNAKRMREKPILRFDFRLALTRGVKHHNGEQSGIQRRRREHHFIWEQLIPVDTVGKRAKGLLGDPESANQFEVHRY